MLCVFFRELWFHIHFGCELSEISSILIIVNNRKLYWVLEKFKWFVDKYYKSPLFRKI